MAFFLTLFSLSLVSDLDITGKVVFAFPLA
jgi:hypothetical protein